MLVYRFTGFAVATVLSMSLAHGQLSGDPPGDESILDDRLQPTLSISQRDAMGLPGVRPRMTMSVPLGLGDQASAADSNDRSAFSWSLEAWQLNTASLAHIQCRNHTMTLDSFLAEDCRFVDQPVPENSVNLVQVRGEWMATPGLRLGMGAFRNHNPDSGPAGDTARTGQRQNTWQPISLHDGIEPGGSSPVDGVDLNVSFGLSTERVGDFLVGLQVARYRQRMSMADLGLSPQAAMPSPESDYFYANSAQLSFGWRRGSLSGDIMGHHRDAPLWLAGNPASAPFQSFDLEFSWRPRNAALSIGISNLLDNAPRLDESEAAAMDEPAEQVFGRIPYVRYKHDL